MPERSTPASDPPDLDVNYDITYCHCIYGQELKHLQDASANGKKPDIPIRISDQYPLLMLTQTEAEVLSLNKRCGACRHLICLHGPAFCWVTGCVCVYAEWR